MKLLHQCFLMILGFSATSCLYRPYYLYDDDCLDHNAINYFSTANVITNLIENGHDIVPFCRRDDFEDDRPSMIDKEIPLLTFDELDERNISSLQLYEWSVHLDLVEAYQAFLEAKIGFETLGLNLSLYACWTKDKFGRHCQYTFNTKNSFDAVVKIVFQTVNQLPSNGTCYQHLNCKRNNVTWCLDWRQICDNRADCWPDHVDEHFCELLEHNECAANEYRCFNGQCIPEVFLLDKSVVPDCLDRTDEGVSDAMPHGSGCSTNGNPSVQCVDTTCRAPDQKLTSCGRPACNGVHCPEILTKSFERNLFQHTANTHMTRECWITIMCLIQVQRQFPWNDATYEPFFNDSCMNVCSTVDASCIKRFTEDCPPAFEFPASSIGWSDLHLLYSVNQTNTSVPLSNYVCYNERRCATTQTDMRFAKISEPSTILSCEQVDIDDFRKDWYYTVNDIKRRMQHKCSLATDANNHHCPQNTHFRCGNKCLSKHRLVNTIPDCGDGSDEILYNESCALNLKHRVTCVRELLGMERVECLPITSVWADGPAKCKNQSELPHFPTLCDGYTEYHELIDKTIETDETNCEAWQCDNQYTRCDGIWNCHNGEDESKCFHPICAGLVGHPCLLQHTDVYKCLPIANVSDGIVDCFGAIDEQQACRDRFVVGTGYRCITNRTDNKQFSNETEWCTSADTACSHSSCPMRDGEWSSYCKNIGYSMKRCDDFWTTDRRITKNNLLCSLAAVIKDVINFKPYRPPQFSLGNYNVICPSVTVRKTLSILGKTALTTNLTEHTASVLTAEQRIPLHKYQCHGGIPVYYENNLKCLCPPSLYGSHCEHQNQRISITLQIGAPEWKTPFTFIVYLLDETYGIVDSYHQIKYVSVRDCSTKFNFNLLYSSRPKFFDRIYAIRIDLFETMTLEYRGSWFFPILFPVLPVYRLPIFLTVPFASSPSKNGCPLKCQSGHGRCAVFVNTGTFFCQCQSGWTGSLCTIPVRCDCSPDSICVNTWKNKSICVCPTHKFGRRCYLTNNLCEQPNAIQCQNGGRCIPGSVQFPARSPSICSCPDGFHGELCHLHDTRIDISVVMPNLEDSLVVHFITANAHMNSKPYIPIKEWGPHERATTFKKIQVHSDLVTIYWQNPFHLIFAWYGHSMFLLFTQLRFNATLRLSITLKPSLRCPSIQELLNTTIINSPRLRRIKYYHIPCQQQSNLDCFHDADQYICLCTHDRRANCFTFDHSQRFSCQQLSYCEHDGQCFQDNVKCPTAAVCACPKCYLGTRCQLSTRGFNLPLDVILGYKIQPGLSFDKQSLSVRMSGMTTMILFIFGLINGILSLMTFQQKELRQVGTGIYLFLASVMSIFTIIMFTSKYILLVVTQMAMVTNRNFLLGQCVTIDFLLKISLQIGDWLYASVAIERLITVAKGTSFTKKRSRKKAKWIIPLIFLVTIASSIHEPFYRELIDDEGRIWCVVRQSSFANLFTSITTVMHFIIPFLINIVSAFGIVLMRTKDDGGFLKGIWDQVQRHKYVIISPIGLIILALPRIILAFQLECMKSAREPVTIFLAGYFISFLPSLLLFIIFVLPSSEYRKAFKKTMTACRKITSR